MKRKSTDIELVEVLIRLNDEDQYHELIFNCQHHRYHDILKPPEVAEPKVELVRALRKFPELDHILKDVLNSEYDEADEWEDIVDLEVELIK